MSVEAYPFEGTYDDTTRWEARAQCGDADPDQFDASGRAAKGTVEGRREITRRKEVIAQYCARCSVVQECLQAALREGDVTTIRGGMTPAERVAHERNTAK